MNNINHLKNKVILITGGTGFLGQALTKEFLKFKPQSIRLFSRDEVKHHNIQKIFKSEKRIRNLLGDVRDYERLKKAMENVDIVIHAAALKRLDLLEYNVEESIKTNILGTLNVANACLETNVEKAVMVSTDKACSPVNTYGACKFVSERIFTESNYNKGSKRTIFTCVRYGNVLQSTGSIIPFVKEKIRKGEKIPLTDRRMTRFIITPERAVNLIMDSLYYSVGGEIFVPKLQSFKITELMEVLKEEFNSNAEIELIGLRPGEKLHELMINQSEIPRTYEFKDMFIITSSIHKYIQIREADYVKNGKKLMNSNFNEYCSKDVIISKSEIKDVFKELGFI